MDKKDSENLSKLAIEWYNSECCKNTKRKAKHIKDFCDDAFFLCNLVNAISGKDLVDVPSVPSKPPADKDKIGEALDALEIAFEAGLVNAKPETIVSGNESAVIELLYTIALRCCPDSAFVKAADGLEIPACGFSFKGTVRKSPVVQRRQIDRGTKTVGSKPSPRPRLALDKESEPAVSEAQQPKDADQSQEKRKTTHSTPRSGQSSGEDPSTTEEPEGGVPVTPKHKASRFGRMFHWKSPSDGPSDGNSVTPTSSSASNTPRSVTSTVPLSQLSSSGGGASLVSNSTSETMLKDSDPSLGSSKRGWTGESFPAWFKKSLSKAVEVNLSLNMLSEVPALLFQNCKDCLQKVDLSGNRISVVSDRLAELKSITSLNLDRNAIETLPASIFTIPGLVSLSVRHCGLKAINVPTDDGPRPPLTDFALDYNELSTLPDGLSQFKMSRNIGLSHNRFTELPRVIALIRKTTDLNVSWNFITTIPENWTQNALCCASIIKLNLSNNQITSIPEAFFASLPRMVNVDISNNRLTALPASLLNLPKLRYLNISGNLLSDTLNLQPALDGLGSLNLSRNQLTALPSLANCRMLESFSASFNPLSTAPLALPSTLTSLNLNGCGLKELASCFVSNMRVMNLAGNHFTEDMLENLIFHDIKSLDVSRNNLRCIPGSVCLASLDTSTSVEPSTSTGKGKSAASEPVPADAGVTYVDWSDNDFICPLRSRILSDMDVFDRLGMKVAIAESHREDIEDLVMVNGKFGGSEKVHFVSLVCRSGEIPQEVFPSMSKEFSVLFSGSLQMRQTIEDNLASNPPKVSQEDYHKAVYRTMCDVYEKQTDGNSGAEVVFAIIDDKSHRLTVCSAGNSRAILSRKGEPVVLSRWLDPLQPEEYRRIVTLGSYVTENGYIGGCCGSAYAVGFGKLRSNHVIAGELSFMETEIDPTNDQFLILASSTLWSCITHERAIEVVREAIARGSSPAEVAAELREWAAECDFPHTSVVILIFPCAFSRIRRSSTTSSRSRSSSTSHSSRSSHKSSHKKRS